eukprot:TRINITY_DN13293_c0_g1_i1.p1 TRINITY_DN13293_c0_g1~~TRINITY_DN13293_c0_g1_i1.p1  ORF type:complete len:643 (+),score=136.35 TRINITY_DN13293_c0_g1_i1:218-2146(+)
MDAPASTTAEPRGGQRHEEDVVLAPMAVPESLERVQMDQIDSGPVDYVIKCTEGLFHGRFIYVNRTPQGELFGSDKGCKDITMYIENANLSPKHTEIKFNDETYQYFLRDFASTDGTWIRIRWNRSIEIAPGQELEIGDTLVEVREGRRFQPEEEVKQWLAAYQLTHLAPLLEQEGLNTMQDVRADAAASPEAFLQRLAKHGLSEEDHPVLHSCLLELDKMWPDSGYPNYALEFAVRTNGTETTPVATIAWEGGTVALAPNGVVEDELDELQEACEMQQLPKDVTVGVVPVTGWEKCEWLRVGYSFGRYYVHLSERSSESLQKGWVRLRQHQRHWLQPHDLFRIGSLEFQVLRFNAAVYSEQGFRATMEDEEILLQDLATSNWRHCSFFGIYDGHGGRECVSFVRQRLHMNIVAALHAKGGLDKSGQVHHDIYDSLMQGFQQTDRQFLNLARNSQQAGHVGGSGCAAVVACIVGGWVWCANLGDSRALLCRDGNAIQLSLDHKPDREDEAKRIESAGGFVSFRRVLGRLAVSRAFGDEEYKVLSPDQPESQPLVIADPEIRLLQLTPEDEFLFMACDGLFDVFSSQEAIDFIHARLAAMPSNEQDPQAAVKDIVHEAIHERRSRDNVTAMLVTFKRFVAQHR